MEMHHRMQAFCSVVAFASCGGAYDISLLIDEREHFVVIVVHIFKELSRDAMYCVREVKGKLNHRS
jgi:hypothetical protein